MPRRVRDESTDTDVGRTEPEFVMYVVGPDGELIDPSQRPDHPRPDAPRLRDLGHAAVVAGRATVHAGREGFESRRAALLEERVLREVQRLGPDARIGRELDRPRRAGFPEEISITLATGPSRARPAALRGEPFTRPVRRLRVDPTTQKVKDREVSWRAALRTGPLRWRSATLRFFASPSSNVSVLTLVPAKPHRVHTRAFIRSGLRAMNELQQRLDRELTLGPDAATPGAQPSTKSG
jgi:hypothetical protein